MKTPISLIVFISFVNLLFMAGCDPGDTKLVLINNSTDTVYFQVRLCRDTIRKFAIVENNEKVKDSDLNILKINEERHFGVLGKWESVINRCDDSLLRVYFFSKNLVKTAGMDSIIKYQLYSKKKKLSVKDLENLNWRITYP